MRPSRRLGWPAGATVGGSAIPAMPDLARMRSERSLRLQDQLDAQGVDGLVLLGSSSVAYATGAALPAQDGDHAALFRPVAVVVKGDSAPHLYTRARRRDARRTARRSPATARCSPTSTTASDVFADALTRHFSAGGPHRRRRPDPRHAARPAGLSTGSTRRPCWARPSSSRPPTRWRAFATPS